MRIWNMVMVVIFFLKKTALLGCVQQCQISNGWNICYRRNYMQSKIPVNNYSLFASWFVMQKVDVEKCIIQSFSLITLRLKNRQFIYWIENRHIHGCLVFFDTKQAVLIDLWFFLCKQGSKFPSCMFTFLLHVFFTFYSLLIFVLGCFPYTLWARRW